MGDANYSNVDMPDIVRSILKPHQVLGVHFLLRQDAPEWNQLGCLLSDTPGAGKTLTVLTYMKVMQDRKVGFSALIVSPKTIVRHWWEELCKWFPAAPQFQRKAFLIEKCKDPSQFLEWQEKGGIMFMSYDTLGRVFLKWFNKSSSIKTDTLVCDEAHILRNDRTRIFLDVSKIQCSFRVLISGSPICNTPEDLFFLLKFIDDNFMSLQKFRSRFSCLMQHEECNALHINSQQRFTDQVNDFRRITSNIALRTFLLNTEIPAKEDWVVKLRMSDLQRRLYDTFVASVFTPCGLQSSLMHNIIHMGSISDAITFHPQLLNKYECEKFASVFAERSKESLEGPLYGVKLQVVLDIVNSAINTKQKLVVFSKSVRALELISKYVSTINHVTLLGTESPNVRETNVRQFNEDERTQLILVSKSVGREGVNLHAADIAVITDVSWNPVEDYQASLRAHRYGRVGKLAVIRLVANETLDEHKLNWQIRKIRLVEFLLSASSELNSEVFFESTFKFLRSLTKSSKRTHDYTGLPEGLQGIISAIHVAEPAVLFFNLVKSKKQVEDNAISCSTDFKTSRDFLLIHEGRGIFIPMGRRLEFRSSGNQSELVLSNGLIIPVRQHFEHQAICPCLNPEEALMTSGLFRIPEYMEDCA